MLLNSQAAAQFPFIQVGAWQCDSCTQQKLAAAAGIEPMSPGIFVAS